MAKRIRTWASSKTRPQHIKSEWLDGELWECTKSEDFPGVKVETFRTYLYRYAAEHGIKVDTEIVDDGTIQFQFLPLQETAGPKQPALEG